MNTHETLWIRLQDAHLVEGELPASQNTYSPWYVRTMLGIAGWIGACFLLGFIGAGLAFVFKGEKTALVVGIFCCTGAFGIFRAAPNNGFITQFGLAASLAGQVMVGYGLASLFARGADAPQLFWLFGAFEAALAMLMPNFIHRVWSAFAATVALYFGFALQGVAPLLPGILALASAVVWLHEFHWEARGMPMRPIGYGLTLGLIQADVQLLLGQSLSLWYAHSGEKPWLSPWIGPLLTGAALVWTVSRLLARYQLPPASRTGAAALAATLIITALALKAPGVSAALLVLLLGFANSNRSLFGLGVIALLTYLSSVVSG